MRREGKESEARWQDLVSGWGFAVPTLASNHGRCLEDFYGWI